MIAAPTPIVDFQQVLKATNRRRTKAVTYHMHRLLLTPVRHKSFATKIVALSFVACRLGVSGPIINLCAFDLRC